MSKLTIIQATSANLDRMWEITLQAQAQLKSLGLDQWQKGYPSLEIWKNDIASGMAYLAAEDDHILGVFAFQTTPDPSYYNIDGAWLTSAPYASMHRVCVADESKGKGVAGKMFQAGFDMAKALGFASARIDTHPGNIPMQRALKKAGFLPCGEIRLVGGSEDGDIRIAFEKIL